MIKYKTISVSGSNTENLADALAGLGERDRKIRALYPTTSHTSGGGAYGYNENPHLRVYVDQNQVVDFDMDAFTQSLSANDFASTISDRRRLPVDIDLKIGQSFRVGFYQSGSTPTGKIVVEYSE